MPHPKSLSQERGTLKAGSYVYSKFKLAEYFYIKCKLREIIEINVVG
jgi:hypothetical protein